MNTELIQKLQDLLKRTSDRLQFQKRMDEAHGLKDSLRIQQTVADIILLNATINTLKQIGNTTTAP